MDQMGFSDIEYAGKRRQTRREKFLSGLEVLIPWAELETLIEPHYPRRGNGRPPYPLSRMLRVHVLQLVYNYSDPAMEDALYEIEPLRRFAGFSLRGALPDETTLLHFRHLLERHGLGERLFERINVTLEAKGLLLRKGTIVDASIIAAPTSTKNKGGARDPEMHQTRKGNQWYFGMKLHIGADAKSGLVHSAVGGAANEHDITRAGDVLHGAETDVHGDAGYQGSEKREEHEGREVTWHIAARPGKRKQMARDSDEEKAEQLKASIRAKVEHPFRWLKGVFGYARLRYRGIAKNMNRFYLLLGLANLLRARNLPRAG